MGVIIGCGYKMAMVSVETQGSIAIIKMQNGENRFTLEFFKQFLAALDEVERYPYTTQ